MKKSLSIIIAVMMLITMIGAVIGCGPDKAEADEIFTGVLVDAQGNTIVVRGDTETMLFETTDTTVYELNDQAELCVGDIVEASYHKGEDAFIADTVRLVQHEEEALVFGGEVTELEKVYLTVQSESLTAVFLYDETTKIVGDLSKGDTVTVTYEGNISENPKAVSIVVVKEKQEIEQKSIHGTVSEVGATSVVISIDSAHAARFHINSDTTYSGDDTKMQIGDEVTLIYTGSVGSDPVAVSVKIKRQQQKKYYVLDGIIEKVSNKNIVVRASKKAYTFDLGKDTKIQNPDFLKPGHRTTITYSGELGKNPVAMSIFCSKDIAKDSAIKKDEAKKDEAKKDEPKKEDSAKPADSEKKDETKPDESAEPSGDTSGGDEAAPAEEDTAPADEDTAPADEEAAPDDSKPEDDSDSKDGEAGPAPAPVVIKAKGEVTAWTDNSCNLKVEGGTIIKLDITEAAISGGYVPQEGDQVIFTYDKDNMKLIDIQLEYRPVEVTE